jgi:hypothetical protein
VTSQQTIEATLAAHATEIKSLKLGQATMREDQLYLRAQLDSLKNWIMATFAAVLVGAAVELLRWALKQT